jgi:hypothetical protein
LNEVLDEIIGEFSFGGWLYYDHDDKQLVTLGTHVISDRVIVVVMSTWRKPQHRIGRGVR